MVPIFVRFYLRSTSRSEGIGGISHNHKYKYVYKPTRHDHKPTHHGHTEIFPSKFIQYRLVCERDECKGGGMSKCEEEAGVE